MTLTQMPHFKHAPSDNIRSSSCPCWWSSPREAPLVTPVRYSSVRSCVLSFRSTAAGFSGLQLTLVGGSIPALYDLERWTFEVTQTMPSNGSGFGWGPCPVRLCRPGEAKTRFGQIRPSGLKYQTYNLFLVFTEDISLHQKPPRSVLRAKQQRHDVIPLSDAERCPH